MTPPPCLHTSAPRVVDTARRQQGGHKGAPSAPSGSVTLVGDIGSA